LEVYDNNLRKKTGSYYTPPEVVSAMVHLVDESLRGPLFERSAGFAASDVIVADPAVGTGTFLLGVLRRIASTVTEDQGAGAVRGAIEAAVKRIIGFEIQFGPFAVAQLRMIAELQGLMNSPPLPELRLFITDTLGNPFIEEETLGQMYEPIAVSRRAANKVKKEERITVVIGNPPYKNQASGLGGWIESGSAGRATPMNLWTPHPEWGVSAHTHHLKNLYVYFWRWATLKVFGSGWREATGEPQEDRYGIVCFITAAGFLNGPGFQKMREDLRRDSSEIWVIDCSPDGHQPDVPTRIFQGVQHQVCIVLAARSADKSRDVPGRLRYIALPKGKRGKKFEALAKLSLGGSGWEDGASGWRDPFLPEPSGAWANVTPEMWAYEVSGKQVLWQWFSYRRRDRSRPIIGDRRPLSPLDSIQPDGWLAEYTTDLLDLLHVLGRLIALEPAQADLLNRICTSPLLGADKLRSVGAFANAEEKSAPTKGKSKSKD
jgi:predicted helicase